MFSVVALDLDGTTLRSGGIMSSFTASTLDELAANGVEVIPSTARAPGSTLPLVDPARFAVCSNGAHVVDQDAETLWEATFDRDGVVDFVTWAMQTVPTMGFGIRAGDLLIGDATYFGLRRQALPPRSVEVAAPSGLAEYGAHILSFRHSSMDSSALAAALAPGLDPELGHIALSGAAMLDLAPPGVSKATGLQRLGDLRGFDRSDVVAFGDMPNDNAMLSWAGQGVAVAGAHADTIASADVVIGQSNDDAVATYLRMLFDLDG